ncbi:MAG: NAD(+) synthase [Bacteroidales bacterium]|nr:NAD(+) synthase [Bacteroidales bacterium]
MVKDYSFNIKNLTTGIIDWIKKYFENNGNGCNAIIGISGGKDSSVAAALCVEALGKDRVIGVLMPNGEQSDIEDAKKLCEHLGINYIICNIGSAYHGVIGSIKIGMVSKKIKFFDLSEQTLINLPARLRMSMLYAVSQSNNGRVVNTCNLSEDWIGWSTRYGDAAGDFAPLAQLTSDEVVVVGEYLGLPEELTRKIPADGLTDKTDEDNFGFTYDILNKYIRTGVCEDEETKKKIDAMHKKNLFKLEPMPCFQSRLPIAIKW